MVDRVFNFSSGPAVLPLPVLEQVQHDLIALPGVRQTRTFFVMKEVVDNAPLDF